MNPTVRILALVAVSATSLTGCAGVFGATMTYNDTETTKITDIMLVNGGGGDVTITAATGTQTTVKRVYHSSTNPNAALAVNGSTLTLDTDCGNNCSVSYQVSTPAGVTVRGGLDSGDLRLTGMGATDVNITSGNAIIRDAAGPVQVVADSGDIEISNPKGKVDATVTSGDIHATGLSQPSQLKADSGDVTAALATATSLTGRVTSGDLDVNVPAGDYKISTAASSGDIALHGLSSNPAAKNILDLTTDSGDISVNPGA